MKKIKMGTMLMGNFIHKARNRADLMSGLDRKPGARIRVIAIEKVLPDTFQQLLDQPWNDYDFIARHADDCCERDGIWESVLIVAEGSPFALAVETEGYSYARYAALIRLPV